MVGDQRDRIQHILEAHIRQTGDFDDILANIRAVFTILGLRRRCRGQSSGRIDLRGGRSCCCTAAKAATTAKAATHTAHAQSRRRREGRTGKIGIIVDQEIDSLAVGIANPALLVQLLQHFGQRQTINDRLSK